MIELNFRRIKDMIDVKEDELADQGSPRDIIKVMRNK
jgi:hypothetical protein